MRQAFSRSYCRGNTGLLHLPDKKSTKGDKFPPFGDMTKFIKGICGIIAAHSLSSPGQSDQEKKFY